LTRIKGTLLADGYADRVKERSREEDMELWKELLSSDVGLLSLITIVLTTAVVGTCVAIFIRKVRSAPQPSE